MPSRSELDHGFVARLLVWLTLSGAFLGYIVRGRELTSVTNFYFIRRSVPEIWRHFQDGLPQIGNPELLDAIYWLSIATVVIGSIAMLWFALEPESGLEQQLEPPALPVQEADVTPEVPDA